MADRSEANVFYEPAMLLPALRYLAVDGTPLVVLVFDDAAVQRLTGLFPTTIADTFRRMPMRN